MFYPPTESESIVTGCSITFGQRFIAGSLTPYHSPSFPPLFLSNSSTGEIEAIIGLIQKETPGWISVFTTANGDFVKVDMAYGLGPIHERFAQLKVCH